MPPSYRPIFEVSVITRLYSRYFHSLSEFAGTCETCATSGLTCAKLRLEKGTEDTKKHTYLGGHGAES